MALESTTILVSCKQTRLHIATPVYEELDIDGLNIAVTSASASEPGKAKGKGKAKSEGLELLNNATLKLKPGVHYGLIGKNGTGKTTLLRAIHEKLIPGIPYETRITALKQTAAGAIDETSSSSVLQAVIERSIAKDDIQRELAILQPAIDDHHDSFAALRAIRRVQHERLKTQLAEMDKDARLRSGSRGFAARKALVEFEKKVKAHEALIDEKEDGIDATVLKEETEAALQLTAELQDKLDPRRLSDLESKARKVLAGLGFAEKQFEQKVSSLSGGWNLRCSLATCLLQESDILILDEPTNFLDLLGILWLQRYLVNLRETASTTVLLVSHDRSFIDTVCEEVIILRDQSLTYFRGNFGAYEKDLRSRIKHLTKMSDALDKQKAAVQKTISQSIKAGKASGDDNKLRQAKSRQKKLDDRMGMNVSAKGTRFKLNRDLAGYHLSNRAEIEIPEEERGITMFIPPAPDLRFPGPLVSLENVSVQYKGHPTLALKDVSLVVHMADRVGIIGLNGAGKSTLIKALMEVFKPTRGSVTKHPRLRLGYYSQHAVEHLQTKGRNDTTLTALSLLTTEVAGELDEGEIRGLLGSLGLPGRLASDVPLEKLSGGQLVRVALARLLWKQPQLLVLDEITTHLDFYTVSALANALSGWNGAIILVSHDRYFVKKVIQGEVEDDEDEEEEGGSEDEEENKRRRVVYSMRDGVLKEESSGVDGFEAGLEKRINKLL
ncbi:P-loop containing nucleoside triphosphate hydrolase protein [Ascobolus immersus RN42]|uniref:P-loop containing nucleoside triphosphate hydrolase protein n=1 Tax=Ascobolus immersus RN42 TaxID=1160509 RepID=A0A3N4IRA2_ASCIM|nr:P-loop containing nucleoside triphosphate hydrolase protein [Ascobolus immersus RN42]